jgi:hypothetical protein
MADVSQIGPWRPAAAFILSLVIGNVANADLSDEARQLVQHHWLDRVLVSEGESDVDVTVRGIPVLLPHLGCVRSDEYFILKKTSSGLEEQGGGTTTYFSDSATEWPCAVPGDPSYVELGVSLEDFFRVRQVISEFVLGGRDKKEVRVSLRGKQPEPGLRFLETSYRPSPFADRQLTISGSFVDAAGHGYVFYLDAECAVCSLTIQEADLAAHSFKRRSTLRLRGNHNPVTSTLNCN